ncbi:HlyD family efflux transporter periplasmic adaptor subunit [Peptococcaceae bacterium 1198_IL3148]
MRKVKGLKIKRLTFSAVMIFSLLMLIAYETAGLVRPLIFHWLINVETMETETATETVPVDGLLIKEEYLFRAPIKGNIVFSVKDGQRVAKATKIAEIKALSLDAPSGAAIQSIMAPKAGSLCTHIDGLEEVLSPATVDVLDLSQIGTIRKEISAIDGAKNQVESGQVVAKLVDNLQPILICMEMNADAVKAEYLTEGNNIRVKHKDDLFTAKVIKRETLQQKQSVLLSANSYPEEIIHLRSTEFELIKDQLSGILVPESALVYRDDQPGIYIIYEKSVAWVAIEIAGELQNKILVNGDRLKTGTRYITTPEVMLEGDHVSN